MLQEATYDAAYKVTRYALASSSCGFISNRIRREMSRRDKNVRL